MRRLLNSKSLSFTRYTEQEIDENYEVIDSVPEADPILAKGSVQPYEQDNDSDNFPEGRNSTTAYIFFTKTGLRYAERNNQSKGDTTTIRGRKYEVFPYEDWDIDFEDQPRRVSYRSYLLIEEEQDGA